jgi:hypothetical protein
VYHAVTRVSAEINLAHGRSWIYWITCGDNTGAKPSVSQGKCLLQSAKIHTAAMRAKLHIARYIADVLRYGLHIPNAQVVVYDSLEYCASLRNLDAVRDAPNFTFVKGDIGTADLVRHVIATEGVDTIMHFAAQTHVDNSFGNSIYFTVN